MLVENDWMNRIEVRSIKLSLQTDKSSQWSIGHEYFRIPVRNKGDDKIQHTEGIYHKWQQKIL